VHEEEERRDRAGYRPNEVRGARSVSAREDPLHRAYVAGRLWMDGSQEHAHGCVRTTLWRMSRLPVPVVEITSTHVALAELVGVEARELEGTAERVLEGCAPPPARRRRAAHPGGRASPRLVRRLDPRGARSDLVRSIALAEL